MAAEAAPAAATADAQPETGAPSIDAPEATEKPPRIQKVEQLRSLLKAKRARTEERTAQRMEERGAKPKGEPPPRVSGPVDADADGDEDTKREKPPLKPKPKDDEPKPAAKAEPKDKPDAKEPAKAEGRDEHGRFLPKDGKPAAEPAKAEPKEPAAKPEPADAPKVEAKPEPKPEPPKEDPEAKRVAERYARLLMEAKRKDEELVSIRESSKAAIAKAERLEKLIARVKGADIDEAALRELTGRSFPDMVRDMRDGKAKYKPQAQLPPELAEVKTELEAMRDELRAEKQKVEAAKKAEAERAARAKADAERQQTIERETQTVKEMLEELREKYPRTHAYKNSAGNLLDRFYRTWADSTRGEDGEPTYDAGKKPDFEQLVSKFEDSLSEEVNGILSSEQVVRLALKDAKTRELVSKILAEQSAPSQPKTSPKRSESGSTANAEGPRTLSNKATQEAPVDTAKPRTKEEIDAWRVEQLRRLRTKNLGAFGR
jgi:hypothetical protein